MRVALWPSRGSAASTWSSTRSPSGRPLPSSALGTSSGSSAPPAPRPPP
uniref:Uncharacterized protein n=1 Tax=Arundo donax TaxID=35708 RepID=A0A0A9EE65_ARUDO